MQPQRDCLKDNFVKQQQCSKGGEQPNKVKEFNTLSQSAYTPEVSNLNNLSYETKNQVKQSSQLNATPSFQNQNCLLPANSNIMNSPQDSSQKRNTMISLPSSVVNEDYKSFQSTKSNFYNVTEGSTSILLSYKAIKAAMKEKNEQVLSSKRLYLEEDDNNHNHTHSKDQIQQFRKKSDQIARDLEQIQQKVRSDSAQFAHWRRTQEQGSLFIDQKEKLSNNSFKNNTLPDQFIHQIQSERSSSPLIPLNEQKIQILNNSPYGSCSEQSEILRGSKKSKTQQSKMKDEYFNNEINKKYEDSLLQQSQQQQQQQQQKQLETYQSFKNKSSQERGRKNQQNQQFFKHQLDKREEFIDKGKHQFEQLMQSKQQNASRQLKINQTRDINVNNNNNNNHNSNNNSFNKKKEEMDVGAAIKCDFHEQLKEITIDPSLKLKLSEQQYHDQEEEEEEKTYFGEVEGERSCKLKQGNLEKLSQKKESLKLKQEQGECYQDYDIIPQRQASILLNKAESLDSKLQSQQQQSQQQSQLQQSQQQAQQQSQQQPQQQQQYQQGGGVSQQMKIQVQAQTPQIMDLKQSNLLKEKEKMKQEQLVSNSSKSCLEIMKQNIGAVSAALAKYNNKSQIFSKSNQYCQQSIVTQDQQKIAEDQEKSAYLNKTQGTTNKQAQQLAQKYQSQQQTQNLQQQLQKQYNSENAMSNNNKFESTFYNNTSYIKKVECIQNHNNSNNAQASRSLSNHQRQPPNCSNYESNQKKQQSPDLNNSNTQNRNNNKAVMYQTQGSITKQSSIEQQIDNRITKRQPFTYHQLSMTKQQLQYQQKSRSPFAQQHQLQQQQLPKSNNFIKQIKTTNKQHQNETQKQINPPQQIFQQNQGTISQKNIFFDLKSFVVTSDDVPSLKLNDQAQKSPKNEFQLVRQQQQLFNQNKNTNCNTNSPEVKNDVLNFSSANHIHNMNQNHLDNIVKPNSPPKQQPLPSQQSNNLEQRNQSPVNKLPEEARKEKNKNHAELLRAYATLLKSKKDNNNNNCPQKSADQESVSHSTSNQSKLNSRTSFFFQNSFKETDSSKQFNSSNQQTQQSQQSLLKNNFPTRTKGSPDYKQLTISTPKNDVSPQRKVSGNIFSPSNVISKQSPSSSSSHQQKQTNSKIKEQPQQNKVGRGMKKILTGAHTSYTNRSNNHTNNNITNNKFLDIENIYKQANMNILNSAKTTNTNNKLTFNPKSQKTNLRSSVEEFQRLKIASQGEQYTNLLNLWTNKGSQTDRGKSSQDKNFDFAKEEFKKREEMRVMYYRRDSSLEDTKQASNLSGYKNPIQSPLSNSQVRVSEVTISLTKFKDEKSNVIPIIEEPISIVDENCIENNASKIYIPPSLIKEGKTKDDIQQKIKEFSFQ